MSDDSQQPIVVKRIKKGGGAAHGGAWKIAYADFVTAMMAFFLLMWLLGSAGKADLKGISEYFQTPLQVALAGGQDSRDTPSLVQGGGADLTRANGQVKRGDTEGQKKVVILQTSSQEEERREAEKLSGLKTKIEQVIDSDVNLKQFKSQLLLDLTDEGLRIQIVDEKSRPMFDSSSAELKPYTREILRQIGKSLNGVDNKISLSGHTDATPYYGGDKGVGNWELSAARANASRRELISGGMDDAKVMRVVGLASAVPLDKSDPFSAINRRISIIVMNKKTEDAILREGKGGNEPKPTGAPAPSAAPSATTTSKPAGH